MTEQDFQKAKVGDTVECIKNSENNTSSFPQKGWKGRIIGIKTNFVSVRWERYFGAGHTCSNLCEDEYGRNYFTDRNGNGNESIENIKIIRQNAQLELF